MDHFYDNQIRRFITQFMRVFIGFKYITGGDTPTYKTVPVMYGDMSRQVATLIRDNSENKMLNVPRIACYISGLDIDRSRASDSTFVSKFNIKQQHYTLDSNNNRVYTDAPGGQYTVERLMPTPFMMNIKAELWTSNTDQKLQLLEQILVLFNPSLELQSTDNYIDWTSLTSLYLKSVNFSSRQIPVGAESDIDICSMEFELPIYLSPPAKVKKLGIVQAIIMNVFTDDGDVINLDDLIYNQTTGDVVDIVTAFNYIVELIKLPPSSSPTSDYDYKLSILYNTTINWSTELDPKYGFNATTNTIYFNQPTGLRIGGTCIINPDNTLTVTVDPNTLPSNTLIPSSVPNVSPYGLVNYIVNPYTYSPIEVYGGYSNIPIGLRLLVLENVNTKQDVGYIGPVAWQNVDGTNPIILENSIIEWDGSKWNTNWTPSNTLTYIQNLTTKVKYRWDNTQWVRAIEGEYSPGSWAVTI